MENKGEISDGYHTFNELYEHRNLLFIALCKATEEKARCTFKTWRSQAEKGGNVLTGWFLLGLNEKEGEQITYHLPMKYWDLCDFAITISHPKFYDGHNSKDVVTRLEKLLMDK